MRKLLSALVMAIVVTNVVATTAAIASESPQVAKGKELYAEFCQRCHGADGQRGEGYQTPIWGPGAAREKFTTVQALFEYLQFLMPFDKPESVTDEQRWDIIAYMMVQHRVLPPGATLDPAEAATIAIKPPADDAAPSPAPASSAVATPTSAISTGDTALTSAGEHVFKRCRACHEIGPAARNKLGPALNGIIGRKAGSIAGFAYSPANRSAGEQGLVWTEGELDAYLADPRKHMPGNRMAFVGLKDDKDRADVIAYLKSFAK